jgi:hypothetical protein
MQQSVLGTEALFVRLAYQPPASGTFLSEQTSHQQSASSTAPTTSQTNRLQMLTKSDGMYTKG